jgi:hypothetical protein
MQHYHNINNRVIFLIVLIKHVSMETTTNNIHALESNHHVQVVLQLLKDALSVDKMENLVQDVTISIS